MDDPDIYRYLIAFVLDNGPTKEVGKPQRDKTAVAYPVHYSDRSCDDGPRS